MFSLTVVVLVVVLSAVLAWRYGLHAVVILLLTFGVLQAVAVTIAETSGFSLADDAAAGVLLLCAVVRAVRSRTRDNMVALAILTLCGLLALVALSRSPDLAIGVAQARQVAIPVGLVFVGFVLRDRLAWPPILQWALVLALLAAGYAIVEWSTGGPLLDPTYYYLEDQDADPLTMRDGLPFAYVSDTPTGTVIRAGGPFLNPPSLGFFLASGVVATLMLGYLLPLAVLALGLAAAFARAGIVIAGMATLVAWTWEILGKWISLVLAAAAGCGVTFLFLRQGNTASHAEGLVSGIRFAFDNPAGQGFGSTGYQAIAATGGINDGVGTESLVGLYAVWFGIPALLLVVAALVRLGVTLFQGRLSASQTWAAIAVLVGAAASETASSLSAAALLWLVCGATLGERDLRDKPGGKFTWKDVTMARRTMEGLQQRSATRVSGRPSD